MYQDFQKNLIFKSISLILVISSLILAFVIYQQINKKSNICVVGNNCFKIWEGKYGTFIYIEWYKWGILYSFFLLLFLIYDLAFNKNFKFFTFFYFLGFLIALYLIFLQIFILKEICFYCLVYDFLIIFLFLINFFKKNLIYFFQKIF